MDLPQETIKELFAYSPETGSFIRQKVLRKVHQRLVGKPSGHLNKALGYVTMHVLGKNRLAHRLAWIYVYGPIPAGSTIDHVNGDRADNRISNLRLATHEENLQNSKRRRDNSSGVKGVSFDRFRGQWMAYVSKTKLGRFDTLFEAACARKSATLKAFGEFSRE